MMTHQPRNTDGLRREMGPFSAAILVVANMIGTGIFATPGFVMAELNHPVSFLLCWLAGGVFALCGALCYGELGVRYPHAGGEYAYLREAFGRPMGFLSGWISLIVGFSAPIAAAAMAFAAYATGLFGTHGGPLWVLRAAGTPLATFSVQTVAASAVILCFTALHYHSLRLGTRVQNSLTLVKVGIIGCFVSAAVLWGGGEAAPVVADQVPIELLPGKWAVSLIFVSFAYSGWNAAAYMGGEIRAPGRNLPLALISGTVVVMMLYMALNTVFLFALTPEQMRGVIDVGTRAAIVLFGETAGRWMGGAISIGLLSVLSAMAK